MKRTLFVLVTLIGCLAASAPLYAHHRTPCASCGTTETPGDTTTPMHGDVEVYTGSVFADVSPPSAGGPNLQIDYSSYTQQCASPAEMYLMSYGEERIVAYVDSHKGIDF